MNYLAETLKPARRSRRVRKPAMDAPRGLVYFWALCDSGDRKDLSRQLRAFRDGGITEVVLHPRGGLLVPYGGADWFAQVKWMVEECGRLGMEAWLYDEDPYPSGSAGGWITSEHPELAAHAMELHEDPGTGGLFAFPAGKLLWAGVGFDDGRPPEDWTARVGTVRLDWEASEWDSRNYYPATPLYDCPRAAVYNVQFALRREGLPPDGRLRAIVAQPVSGGFWGRLADSLNPAATKKFLALTHERYLAAFGDELGRTVRKIFTDEAKTYGTYPWTPGMFEAFAKDYGYDLRQRLDVLFRACGDAAAMRVRMDYREWIGRRFEDAWFRPVSEWCRRHGLSLLGHLSPEEDPVNQSALLGNLLPMQRWMDCAGFDLIVPAVGDAGHPILNIGFLQAVSTAQQFSKPGVCSESLGVTGYPEPSELARVLAWQAGGGVNFPVIHAAFSSMLGLRRYDAPPDLGPDSEYWPAMQDIHRRLQPFWDISFRASQDAPVAILWPIRSFQASGQVLQSEAGGLRGDLFDLVLQCLERQIGIHLLDEDILARGRWQDGCLRIGKARYRTVLMPSTLVIDEATWTRLDVLRSEGLEVIICGMAPQWLRRNRAPVRSAPRAPWPVVPREEWSSALARLPRVCELAGPATGHLRATVWRKRGGQYLLLQNIGRTTGEAVLKDHAPLSLSPGELIALRKKRGRWSVALRFDPGTTPAVCFPVATAAFGRWKMTTDRGVSREDNSPKPLWCLQPAATGTEWRTMTLTGAASLSDVPQAEFLDYETTLILEENPGRVTFLAEPTLMRGSFEMQAGTGRWEFQCADSDFAAHALDLTPFVAPGPNPIRIRVRNPRHLDGIKWCPRVELHRTGQPDLGGHSEAD